MRGSGLDHYVGPARTLMCMLGALGKHCRSLVVFLLGAGLRRARLMTADDGSALLKLVFCAGVPARRECYLP
jgi:hypothetical protein